VFKELDIIAYRMNDHEAAKQMQQARKRLFAKIHQTGITPKH